MPSRSVKQLVQTIHQLQPYRNTRAFWLALASAIIMSGTMVLGAISTETHIFEEKFHIEFIIITNLIIFGLLYHYNFYIVRCRLRTVIETVLGIGGSLLIAILFTMLSHWVEMLIYGTDHTTNNFIINTILNAAAAIIAYLITYLLSNVTEYQQALVENEHLQTENMVIRYETLEQQLSPHFLFNSLNTLGALIGIDDENARRYTDQLAATFRYIIQKQKIVSLGDELEFTNSYVYMMKIRHGKALKVTEKIDHELLNLQLPPISLQLLVENAIKHNVLTTRHPIEITIETITTDEGPALRVSNPLRPKADIEISSGIGLSNLNQRYELLFHRTININKEDNTFMVEIPLI